MKDLSFLKSRYFVYKGIYDNKNVYNDSFYRIKKQINCDNELKIDKTYKINNK